MWFFFFFSYLDRFKKAELENEFYIYQIFYAYHKVL